MSENVMPPELCELVGMRRANGYYGAEYWCNLTGINPANYPGWVEIAPRNQLCCWTAKAEKYYQMHARQVAINWIALGIPA